MVTKWTLEPIENEFLGWTVTDETIDDSEKLISIIKINNDLESSIKNAALIAVAPELLDMCKEIFQEMESDNKIYGKLSELISIAEGNGCNKEVLQYFEKAEFNIEPVINIDFSANTCKYVTTAKMKDFIHFVDVSNNVGIISLNVTGKFLNEEDYEKYDLKYPIDTLISKSVYTDFLDYMSALYINLKEFMIDFNQQKQSTSFCEFIREYFYGEFKNQYIKKMDMREYIKEYPLIFDTETLFLNISLPKHLEDCPHSLHENVSVTYNGQTKKGIVILKDENIYIYNQAKKEISFFIIPLESADKAKVEFVDYLSNYNKK